MEKLIRLSVQNQTLTFFTVFIIMLIGLQTFLSLPQNEDPQIDVRAVQIITYWPGATPEDIELYVTKPLEEAVSKQDSVKTIYSQSLPGASVITVTISDYVTKAAVTKSFLDIRNYVNDIRGDLPDGLSGPIVNDRFGETRAFVLGLVNSSGNRSYRELESIAERIKEKILTLDSIADFEILGAQREKIYIDISMEYFANLGINPYAIYEAVDKQNVQLAQPYINISDKRVLIEVSGLYKSIEQIKDTIIHTDKDGRLYRIRDLKGRVFHGYEDPPIYYARVNTRKSLIVNFGMKRGQNIVKWGKMIDRNLEEIRKDLPADIELQVLSNQPSNVEYAVKDFMSNFYQAIIIVLVVIGIGMGLRNAMVVTIAVPLIMLATFAVMGIQKIELQQMSINALIIALGMVVDNAIVITDNVNRYIDMGYSNEDAAIAGAKEVKVALFSGTLTTIAAFLPLALMPGDTGAYISSLPMVISTALIISYLVAMFVSPAAACFFLPNKEQKEKRKEQKEQKQKNQKAKPDLLRKIYYKIIDLTQSFKYLVILGLALLFAGAIYVAIAYIPVSFFPSAENTHFVLNVSLPNGWDITATDKVVQQIEHQLEIMKTETIDTGKEDMPKIVDYITYIGGGGPRFHLSIAPLPDQKNIAQFMIITPSPKATNRIIEELDRFMKTNISAAKIDVLKLETGPSVGAPIQIKLGGTEVRRLKEIGEEIKMMLLNVDGISSINDDFGVDSEKLVMQIDQEKAKMLGITTQDIAVGIYVGVEGHTISRMKSPERQIDIVLRTTAEERGNIEDLKAMTFTSSRTGFKHRLDEFAKIYFDTQTSAINRYNQRRTLTLGCYVKGKLASEVLKEIRPKLDAMELDKGYSISYGGEEEKSGDAFGDLAVLAVFALFLLLLILAFQFKSLRIAAAIYLAIPFAFIGAVAGMYFMKQPLGFMSALGLISLAGIVVNNAIIMIEFIQENMSRGIALVDAIKEAGITRFRPIMLTTISTLGGLFPLALFGGVLFAPMCWVIIFGLAFSTLLTLIVIPLFFVVFGGDKDTMRLQANEARERQAMKPAATEEN